MAVMQVQDRTPYSFIPRILLPLQPTNTENQPLLIGNKTETVSLKSLLLRWRELVPFLGVFAPLVVFWAIFYQQNSTWVQQGDQMDCYLGSLHVPPG